MGALGFMGCLDETIGPAGSAAGRRHLTPCAPRSRLSAKFRPVPILNQIARKSQTSHEMPVLHPARTSSVALLAAALVGTGPALRAEVDRARVLGQPGFDDGEAFGDFVWLGGDTWKVRWTTFGANHRFSGSVTVEGGELRSFKRIDVDTDGSVLLPGRGPRVVRGPRGRVRAVGPGRRPVSPNASRTRSSRRPSA
jgi:hypothetical protein